MNGTFTGKYTGNFTDCHRFVGWITNFIHNRDLALENMVRGYMVFTIPRKMDPVIKTLMVQRCQEQGLPLPNRSVLMTAEDNWKAGILVSGSQKLVIKAHSRNSRKLDTQKVPGLQRAIEVYCQLNNIPNEYESTVTLKSGLTWQRQNACGEQEPRCCLA